MRQLLLFTLSFGALAAFGQTPADSTPSSADKRIELATQELQRIQKLFEIGAESRARVEQAQQDLADARDDAVVQNSLSSPLADSTDQALTDAAAAAQRRLERQQARVEQARKLVDSGIVALSYVTPFEEELATRQATLDLVRSRAQLRTEMAELARNRPTLAGPPPVQAQEAQPAQPGEVAAQGMEHYQGRGRFSESKQLKPIERAFQKKFDRPLPISADGETALHRSLGFDHRGRVDVAVNPQAPEGIWLRRYLRALKIPYYAFLRAIPGKATAAHIHIGPGSTRLAAGD